MEMMSSFFHQRHPQHLFQTKPHFSHFMADDNSSSVVSGSATRHSSGGGGGGGGGSDTESRDSDQSLQTQQSPEVHGSNSSPESKYPEYCRTLTVTDANGQVKELVFPKALDLDRPKRARTTFSSEQLYQLEKDFQKNQYLVGRERTELAQRLNLSETQVKVWFQNRRTKFKRDKQRQAETREAKAESMAACNIMRLLENRPSLSAQTAPIPVVPSMPFVLPPPPPPPGLFGRPFS